jgi:transcriptional regulator with XRE-family HTH domain
VTSEAGHNPAVSHSEFGPLLRRARRERGRLQSELAGMLYVSASKISRLESGAMLPRGSDVEQLAGALALPEAERAKLRAAARHDNAVSRELPPIEALRIEDLVDVLEDHVALVRNLRLAGSPRQAADRGEEFSARLREVSGHVQDETAAPTLLRLQASLLAERCKSLMDFVLPAQTATLTAALIAEQRAIAKRLQDERTSILTDLTEESVLYVGGRVDLAHNICTSLLSCEPSLLRGWWLEILRAGAINLGMLRATDGLNAMSRRIDGVLAREDSDPSAYAFLLEGLARGQSAARDSRAFDTLERAWEQLDRSRNTGGYSPLRRVQLTRTSFQAIQRLNVSLDTETQRLGEEAVLIASELGYTRPKRQIEGILADLT